MEDVLVSLTRASDLQISPDGRWVAYVADPYSVDPDKPWRPIWIAPTDGSTSARQLTSWSGRDGHPRWSPDGRTLAFLSDREEKGTDALYLIPIDGGEARLALKPARGILDFRWAPDGGRICFRAVDEPSDDEKRRIKERDDPDVFGQRWPFARLSLLDVATGQVARVPTGDGHVTALPVHP